MRERRAPAGAALLLAALAACARQAPPPGGPDDRQPPALIAASPDTLAVLPGFDDWVVFTFDEAISDGSQPNWGLGTGDLEKLVLLSPADRIPVVKGSRRAIRVKPREGWRPNTVYRVELLPGAADFKGNRSRDRRVVTFTTGAPAPTATVAGRVTDWTTSRPATAASLVLLLLPDSLRYHGTADSSGAVRYGPIGAGRYLVTAFVDQNRNRRADGRELWDSVTVTLDSAATIDLWLFPHDTTEVRLQSATARDSVTAVLTFSQKLDPYQPASEIEAIVLALPDSTPVRVLTLLPPARHDSLYRPAADTTRPARADTARAARADTAAPKPPRAPKPAAAGAAPAADSARPTRPPLDDKLLLRVAEPLVPGGRYLVTVRGVRNVTRVPANPRTVLAVPEPPARAPRDTARDTTAAADTTGGRVPADSARRAPPDSARPAPRDSTP